MKTELLWKNSTHMTKVVATLGSTAHDAEFKMHILSGITGTKRDIKWQKKAKHSQICKVKSIGTEEIAST